jgi:GTPase Era involved in 16S rRNA processing
MSAIDDELLNLTKEELIQVMNILTERNKRAEKDLYDILTMIRVNKRAQGGRG